VIIESESYPLSTFPVCYMKVKVCCFLWWF